MLDDINLKIIFELCHDGRLSNAKLAQKVGINVLTSARRVKELVSEGVITIKAMPNPIKMGYKAGAFVGLDVDMREIEGVCTQLMHNPHINLLTTCFGRYDVLLIIYFHDWEMLQDFVRVKLPKIEGVKNIETFLISESKKRYQSLITNDSSTSEPALLDDIDSKLIVELIRNGRPKYIDLAKKLGISASTVSRRIAFLIKEDIIWLRAVPNPAKLGYSANAFVVLHAELSKIDKICDQLSSYPEIHLVERLMNGYDILFGIDSANPETLYEFFRTKIANIDGILNSETFIRGTLIYVNAADFLLPSISVPSFLD